MTERKWKNIDCEGYRATVRTRYRKYLIRKGVPAGAIKGLKTAAELRELAVIVSKHMPSGIIPTP